MKTKAFLATAISALLLSISISKGIDVTQVDVNIDSGNYTLYNQGTTALSAGTSAEGDGAIVELGYYSLGTVSNPFAGTFIALSGVESANTGNLAPSSSATEIMNQTSIGDTTIGAGGSTDGVFGIKLNFITGSATQGLNLPAVGTPLVIKFYNSATLADATYFNAVANTSSWLWPTAGSPPNDPTLGMSLNKAGLTWYSVAVAGQSGTSAFHTTVSTVPEPTSIALLGGGLLLLGSVMRRRK